MMKKLQFQAVIFDMDGLMFDTERVGLEAFRHSARAYGYEDTKETFLKMIGRNVKDANQIMREDFGESFPIDDVRKGRLDYIERYQVVSGIPMKPGLLELLSFLAIKNVPLAVASSSNRVIIERFLKQAGIDQYFQYLVGGDEVRVGKPNPEIFQIAAKRLGIEDPASCIVLEDSGSGILAAHSAGMIPILIPDIRLPTLEILALAHQRFSSLHDVRKYLAETCNDITPIS